MHILRLLLRDGPWMVLFLAGAALGQLFAFHDGAIPIVSSDGLLYLSDAHALPSLHGLVDPRVPPGYPLLLAGVFVVAGHDNLSAVMIFQAVLFVAAMLELHALLTTLGFHRLLAAAVVAMLAAAPWLVQWERYILTEAVSIWALITLFLAFVRLLRRATWSWALVCGVIAALIPITRPALIAAPATLLLVLLLRAAMARRIGVPMRGQAVAAIVFGVVSFLPVGVYIAANAAANNCYCYTNTSNKNLFGKIYEYGMQDFAADAQFSTLAEQVRAADSVNHFFQRNPQYEAQNYAPLGAFARSQFFRYPGFTAQATVREIGMVLTLRIDRAVLVQHPFACTNDSAAPYPLMTADALQASDFAYCPQTIVGVGALGENVNRAIYFLIFLAYAALPIGLALGVALSLAQPARERAWLLLATTAVVASVIVTSAITGYSAFDRLKVPVDPIAVVAAMLMLSEVWFVASRLPSSRHVQSLPAEAT